MRRHVLALVSAAALVPLTAVTGPAAEAAPALHLDVRSNRADLVSGGDALVAVNVPHGVDPASVRVAVGGRDVTGAFAMRPGGRFEGLVTGLANGANALTASAHGVGTARVTIRNHPIGGPVFSGPQVQPWVCGNGSTDPQCDAPVKYDFLYKSTNPFKNGLQAYDQAKPPGDVATTTTDQGVKVPFIVRKETGYQDRDQYTIQTLYQPGKPWTPWRAQRQFNHKLLVTHGSRCGVTYGSGTAADGEIAILPSMRSSLTALGRGFAVMSTALDNNGHNCNIATQAESLVMAK